MSRISEAQSFVILNYYWPIASEYIVNHLYPKIDPAKFVVTQLKTVVRYVNQKNGNFYNSIKNIVASRKRVS